MSKSLELKKPLVFIKVQTTGLNHKVDRIIEICFLKINVDGTEKQGIRYINPGFEIDEEITKINGITNEILKDKPSFDQVAGGIFEFIKDCDFAGFAIKDFDLKFLIEEFTRAGIAFDLVGKNVIDLMVFYRKMFPRNFKEAISFYLKEELSENVSSANSVKYSKELLNKMIETHTDQQVEGKIINNDINNLGEVLNSFKGRRALDNSGYIVLNEEKRPILTMGKYNGMLVADSLMNDKEYYHWMVDKSDLPIDTKNLIKRIVQKAKEASVDTSKS